MDHWPGELGQFAQNSSEPDSHPRLLVRVVCDGDGNVAVAEGAAGGVDTVFLVNERTELFAQFVERFRRVDAFWLSA